MYRKQEASVESVIGGVPKKTSRQSFRPRRSPIDSAGTRVEKMKTVRLKKKGNTQDPGTLDGGIILE